MANLQRVRFLKHVVTLQARNTCAAVVTKCKDISSILTIWLSSILLSFFLSIPVLPSLIYSPHRLVKVFDLGLFPVLRLCEPHHLFLAVWLAEKEFKKIEFDQNNFPTILPTRPTCTW